jgi:hypothetical protein
MSIDDVLSALDAQCFGVNGSNGEPKYCECDETLVHGVRVPAPPGHDCEYVRARSVLVTQALKIADARVPVTSPHKDGGVSHSAWMKAFVAAMDELSKPLL